MFQERISKYNGYSIANSDAKTGEYVGPFTVIAVIFWSSEVIRPEGAPNSLRRPDTTGRGVWRNRIGNAGV